MRIWRKKSDKYAYSFLNIWQKLKQYEKVQIAGEYDTTERIKKKMNVGSYRMHNGHFQTFDNNTRKNMSKYKDRMNMASYLK